MNKKVQQNVLKRELGLLGAAMTEGLPSNQPLSFPRFIRRYGKYGIPIVSWRTPGLL